MSDRAAARETMTRRDFLRRLGRRPEPRPLDQERLKEQAVPEEERMMGWMSLRRQLVKALVEGSEERLSRYVSLEARRGLDLSRLLGAPLPGAFEERPEISVVSQEYIGPGAAFYTVRERRPTALSEALFGAGQALEAYFQVTGGRDWLLRELHPA